MAMRSWLSQVACQQLCPDRQPLAVNGATELLDLTLAFIKGCMPLFTTASSRRRVLTNCTFPLFCYFAFNAEFEASPYSEDLLPPLFIILNLIA